jgi:elongation factor G
MFAALTMAVEPVGGADDPVVIVDKEGTAALTNDERASLVDGLAGALSRGPRGFPVVGVRVRVLSAERDGDTSPGAVRACCAVLIDRVLRGPAHALLEPLMALEAELPLDRMGDVLSDLTVQRRAIVKEVQTEASHARVFALVPLATMLGYATALRSMTGGEGSFSLEFAEYSPPLDPLSVPP